MIVIVGSVAAKYHFSDFREAKDLDILCDLRGDLNWPFGGDAHFHSGFKPFIESAPRNHIATPEMLYTLKASHANWNVNWEKTMFDILFFQKKGLEIDEELFKSLYKVWTEVHGPKPVMLGLMADDFFADAVTRIYVHDSIHESVAYYDHALYIDILADGHDVKIDPVKMWAMDHDTLIKLAREEIYATALERWVIPSNYTFSPRQAYARALKLTITSLTKGRFARFIITNFSELMRPDIDYVTRHLHNKHKLIKLEPKNELHSSRPRKSNR